MATCSANCRERIDLKPSQQRVLRALVAINDVVGYLDGGLIVAGQEQRIHCRLLRVAHHQCLGYVREMLPDPTLVMCGNLLWIELPALVMRVPKQIAASF